MQVAFEITTKKVLTTVAAIAMLIGGWLLLAGGSVPNILQPQGDKLVTIVAESGEPTLPQSVLIASLRMRDENQWEHDLQVLDPDDPAASPYKGPHPSIHIQPLAGGEVQYSGVLPDSMEKVDALIEEYGG